MDVVPTSDGDDDDGVIWYRCPQCQGFLPKLKSTDPAHTEGASNEGPVPEAPTPADPVSEEPALEPASEPASEPLEWDSPADMMASENVAPISAEPVEALADDALDAAADDLVLPEVSEDPEKDKDVDPDDLLIGASESQEEPETEHEPILEYAAMLAAQDPSTAVAYRPWESYEIGQCIHHLAWDDCGIVVTKEKLPGNRQIIKAFFEGAGVVRLIENAPR